MIAPSVPHLLPQTAITASSTRLGNIAYCLSPSLYCLGLEPGQQKAFTPGVGSFPSLLAFPPTVEIPAPPNETSITQAILGPSYRLTSSNIGNRKD
jgi:hypothetical protein